MISLANLDNKQVIIAHNRAATLGEVSDHMAHPFTYGDITMVHNGTLHNHYSLHKDCPPFASDSEALCWTINHIGAEAALREVDGAFSIIWHDRSDNTINISRNDERPMSFVRTKCDKIVLASDNNMLEWLLARAHMPTIGDILIPTEGHILTYKLGETGDFTSREIELRPAITYRYSTQANHTYNPPKKDNQDNVTKINVNRVDRVNALLGKSGLLLGGTLVFWGSDLKLYREGGDMGTLEGYDSLGNDDIEIIAHKVLKSDLVDDETNEFSSALYEATVKGAADLDGVVTVTVENLRPIDVDKWYDGNNVIYLKESHRQSASNMNCDICGGFIKKEDPGHLPVNEHVIGEKDSICCFSCAEIIKSQGNPDWDSLLITTVM